MEHSMRFLLCHLDSCRRCSRSTDLLLIMCPAYIHAKQRPFWCIYLDIESQLHFSFPDCIITFSSNKFPSLMLCGSCCWEQIESSIDDLDSRHLYEAFVFSISIHFHALDVSNQISWNLFAICHCHLAHRSLQVAHSFPIRRHVVRCTGIKYPHVRIF